MSFFRLPSAERDKRLAQMKKEATVLTTTRSQLEEQQKELNKKFTEVEIKTKTTPNGVCMIIVLLFALASVD